MKASCMFYRHILAIGVLLAAASSSQADLHFRFRNIATNQVTNPLIMPLPFDSWVFEVYNSDPANGNIDRLSLVFGSSSGSLLQAAGNISFRNESQGGATTPTLFGFLAPETFFLLPGSANPIAFSVTDTSHSLTADYVASDHSTLVPVAGTYTPVAFFSVPSGQALDIQFLAGAGWHGTDPPQRFNYALEGEPPSYIPLPAGVAEPASFSLLGLFLLGAANIRRRSI